MMERPRSWSVLEGASLLLFQTGIESWRIPGEPLLCSLYWDPEEVDFTISHRNGVDHLPARGRASRQKSKFSSPLYINGPDLAWVFLLQTIQLQKSLTTVPWSLSFRWFQMQSSWQTKLANTQSEGPCHQVWWLNCIPGTHMNFSHCPLAFTHILQDIHIHMQNK